MKRPSSVLAALAALAAAACGNDRNLLGDASPDRAAPADVAADRAAETGGPDAGPPDVFDAATDAPIEADASDGAAPDADAAADVAAPPDAPADAAVDAPGDVAADAPADGGPSGRCAPTIDGTVGADWTANALVARNAVATAWTNNELRAIRVCYDATNLYLGIEGTVEAMNAIVVYLDRDYGGGAGGGATGISVFSALTDNAGQLDNAISAGLTLGMGAGPFGAEAAWGTAGLRSLTADRTDVGAGLRLFWPPGGTPDRRADFAYAMGAASACRSMGPSSMHACEVAIAWTALYEGARPASTRVGLFARINNSDGAMSSNQTLPEDNALAPRTVNRVLVLDVAP